MSHIEVWELLSYLVTVFGLPLAIYMFVLEQRKERENEEEEVNERLAESYHNFLTLVLEHPDLKLRTQSATPNLSDEQREQVQVLFEILVALFERAYLTSYDDVMTPPQRRRWHSWDDFMREWCRRDDFYEALPELLAGEDEQFAQYLTRIADDERRKLRTP